MEYAQYFEKVYDAAIKKLQSGAKRIIFTLPVGGGKTTRLIRIAKEICRRD